MFSILDNIKQHIDSRLVTTLGVLARAFAHCGHHIGSFDYIVNPNGRKVAKSRWDITPHYRDNFCTRFANWCNEQQNKIMMRSHEVVCERALKEREEELVVWDEQFGWEVPTTIPLDVLPEIKARNARYLTTFAERNPNWQDEMATEVAEW